jgi:hypothetical protein
MRKFVFVAIVSLLIATSACDENNQRTRLTFVNSSDVSLCFGVTVVDPQLCSEVKPHSTSSKKTDCYGSMKVVLIRRDGTQALYTKNATCDEWQGSGGTFIIKQEGEGVSITDSLPEASD